MIPALALALFSTLVLTHLQCQGAPTGLQSSQATPKSTTLNTSASHPVNHTKTTATTPRTIAIQAPKSKRLKSKAKRKSKTTRKVCSLSTEKILPAGPHKDEKWIYLQHNLFLAINGSRVWGTEQRDSVYVVMEIRTVGPNGLFVMMGKTSRRYLSMNSTGRLYSSLTYTDESVFKRSQQKSGFYNYKSYKYCWYVGFKRSGEPKVGPRVYAHQHGANFLEGKVK